MTALPGEVQPSRAHVHAHRAAAAALLALAIAVAASAALGAGPSPRLLVLLLIAPVIEEAFFRAGIQEMLIRHGMRATACVGLTALAFAFAHVLVRQDWAAVSLLLPAMAIGVLYQRSRSLTSCVLLHAGMNAIWLGWAG